MRGPLKYICPTCGASFSEKEWAAVHCNVAQAEKVLAKAEESGDLSSIELARWMLQLIKHRLEFLGVPHGKVS
jgi:DNA-directed RNA polymerase subunit RPC12/RpoP